MTDTFETLPEDVRTNLIDRGFRPESVFACGTYARRDVGPFWIYASGADGYGLPGRDDYQISVYGPDNDVGDALRTFSSSSRGFEFWGVGRALDASLLDAVNRAHPVAPYRPELTPELRGELRERVGELRTAVRQLNDLYTRRDVLNAVQPPELARCYAMSLDEWAAELGGVCDQLDATPSRSMDLAEATAIVRDGVALREGVIGTACPALAEGKFTVTHETGLRFDVAVTLASGDASG